MDSGNPKPRGNEKVFSAHNEDSGLGFVLVAQSYSACKKSTDSDCTVRLDTQANIHLFCNPHLLHEIQPLDESIEVKGINGNSISINYYGITKLFGNKVYFSPESAANILSFQVLKSEDSWDITYFKKDDYFQIRKNARFF